MNKRGCFRFVKFVKFCLKCIHQDLGQALSPTFFYLGKLFRNINLNLDTTKVVQVLVVFHWLKFKSIASLLKKLCTLKRLIFLKNGETEREKKSDTVEKSRSSESFIFQNFF